MTVVIAVHTLATGGVERYELAPGFWIGSLPGCDVHLPWHNPSMPEQQIGLYITTEAIGTLITAAEGIGFELDGAPIDLTVPNLLRAGSRIRAGNQFEIVLERVPDRPADIAVLKPRFDHSGAAEFDRDMERLEAARPPPPPDASDLTLDLCTRKDLPNLERVLALVQPTLAELEAALGLELPFFHCAPGFLDVKAGTTGGPLASFSVHWNEDDFLQRALRRARRIHVDYLCTWWRSGRSAWASLLSRLPPGFGVADWEADGFVLRWTRPEASAVDDARRVAWLRELAGVLRRISTLRELREHLAAVPSDLGFVITEPFTISLIPPTHFAVLADALDYGPYSLKTDFSDHTYCPSWFDDRIGSWRLEANIDPRRSTLHVIRLTPSLTRASRG